MQRILLFLLTFSFMLLPALGQARFDANTKTFRMDGGETTYIFGINEQHQLQALYWGSRLGDKDQLPAAHSVGGPTAFEAPSSVTPQEYAGWGGGLQWEPALKVTFPDGNRDLVLQYQDHKSTTNGFDIHVRDIERNVNVTLHYSIDPETGIVKRWSTIRNDTSTPVLLEQASSATYVLAPAEGYQLNFLTGRWAGEWQRQIRPITQGATVLESRIGSTSAAEAPWFAIARNSDVGEEHGDVWFGELGWSGSWRITVEQDTINNVRITGGYNSFDFGYSLASGESLETPTFYAGFSGKGYGNASRLLHRFQIEKILPGAPNPRLRPVLYNSWEATGFAVSEQGQIELAEKAAALGVERFVMDDGWFGEGRSKLTALGDWYVTPETFPHGLGPLISRVHALGMDFGLWVEPEMVNPGSDLYAKHPDWVLHFDGRPRTEGRHQLVLNLALPEVHAYVLKVLDDLLTKNDIAFLKWDYNRPWSEPGWPQAAVADQKKVYVLAVQNFYSILDELHARHPQVEIESCSSGGGRVDLGVLQRTVEVWPSDNSDAFARLTMQEGFTRAYTPGIMMAWVTDVPNFAEKREESLDYRFLVAMQGALGIGANLNKMSAEDMALSKERIRDYKTIRSTIQRGQLYRLISPVHNNPYSAAEYVSNDATQVVLFAYLHSSEFLYPFPRLQFLGLQPDAQYKLRSISGKLPPDAPLVASGRFWMGRGLQPALQGDFKAAAFVLERQ